MNDPKADLWKVLLGLSALQQITVIAMAIAVAGVGFAIGKWSGVVESKAQIISLEGRLRDGNVSARQRPECEATIINPEIGAKVPQKFQVRAVINEIPKGFLPWVVTTERKNYWPQGPATIGKDGIWTGLVNTLGGKEGKSRSFALLLVGKDGQLLFDAYDEGWVKGRDPLKDYTDDTAICEERNVIFSENIP